jgi:hypothetical protein
MVAMCHRLVSTWCGPNAVMAALEVDAMNPNARADQTRAKRGQGTGTHETDPVVDVRDHFWVRTCVGVHRVYFQSGHDGVSQMLLANISSVTTQWRRLRQTYGQHRETRRDSRFAIDRRNCKNDRCYVTILLLPQPSEATGVTIEPDKQRTQA